MLLSQTDTSFISLSSSASFLSYSAWFCYSFSYSAITVSNSSVPFCVSPPPVPAMRSDRVWFCMSLVLLLCWVCVWAVVRLQFMVDRVCMARFASRGLSLTVSLPEVSWGQYHPLCFHFSNCCRGYRTKADIRKCINIWSLMQSTFWHKQGIFFFKCCQHFKEVSLHSV